jgi:hypothetical protein
MDLSRCTNCRKRLMAITDRTGRTKLVCLKCDNIDPMKTDAAKWANRSLAMGCRGREESSAGAERRSTNEVELVNPRCTRSA